MDKRAETVAEAEAQPFTIPPAFSDDEWRGIAAMLDGYKISEELGVDLRDWGAEQEQRYKAGGRWELNLLELRLMLFYEFRADYFTGYTYHERDSLVDSLFAAISEKTGQPYQPMKPAP